MADYYIRQSEGDAVRGPFDEEQVTSLAEAGKITLETQIADETKTDWVVVGQNEELKAMLFPERKKLGLKKGGEAQSFQKLNKPEDDKKPAVTVEQMLAAAEGHTEGTKHLMDTRKHMDKAAMLSMPVLCAMMLLSGLANTLPRYNALLSLTKGDWQGLLHEPLAIIGLLDFVLALGLFLKIFSLLPIVRFRAMAGIGFFVYYCWCVGDTVGMAAAVVAGVALFVCSLTLNLVVMILFALAGVGSMGYLAWAAWTALSGTTG